MCERIKSGTTLSGSSLVNLHGPGRPTLQFLWCMAGGKKGATLLVKLISTAGTGFFYVAKKNPRKLPNKLQVHHPVGGLSAEQAGVNLPV